MKDNLYIDKVNGRYEMFTYSDGNKVYIGFFYDMELCQEYARVKHYKVIEIK
jgi:hypothetical protein